MSRTVFCRKYQEQLSGLNTPPYPGAKGQDIFENISQKAWQEWQKQQKYLQAEMDKFLSNQDHDKAEGFVPQE